MKKMNRIIFILTITFLIVSIFNVVFAIEANTYKPDDLTTDDAVGAVKKVGIVLGAVRNISAVVSVIVLTVIGLKYIFGSVEEKANYKATIMPYFIGCILAVAGTTLVSFIYNSVH